MTAFWFIRHGETDWNAEGRLQGQREVPLNARGRRQATQCGVILRDLIKREGLNPADLSYLTSPMARARETMELLRVELALPRDGYAIDAALKEIHFGEWEGFTYPELRLQHAALVAARERDRWNHVVPGGESYAMVQARLAPCVAGFCQDQVVVAHGGVARAIMVQMGITTPAKAGSMEIAQGVVYRLAPGSLARYA
jgi:broad specificity phosphatase PhoE